MENVFKLSLLNSIQGFETFKVWGLSLEVHGWSAQFCRAVVEPSRGQEGTLW